MTPSGKFTVYPIPDVVAGSRSPTGPTAPSGSQIAGAIGRITTSGHGKHLVSYHA